jgi:hypothetical protein
MWAHALRSAIVLAIAVTFWGPALSGTRGHFPAPLDDVFIYVDYARGTADGCLLCYDASAGPGTGATSPLYALLIAPAALVTSSPKVLGWWIGALTLLLLGDATAQLAKLLSRSDGSWSSRALTALAPLLVFVLPIATYALVSGMESALVLAALARTLAAVDRLQTSDAPTPRARRELVAGVAIAVLGTSRPELLPMGACFVVAALHTVGPSPGVRPLASATLRLGGPLALLQAAIGLQLWLASGRMVGAGALRKVVLYDPSATAHDMLVLARLHVLRLVAEGGLVATGGLLVLALFTIVALRGLRQLRERRLSLPLAVGAASSFVLVAFNTTAPFQNFRYLAPTYLALMTAAIVGIRRAGPRRRWVVAAAVMGALAAARTWPRQLEHFARAAKNIHEQQIEVGLRLAHDPPRLVFVGDAGAIPLFSGRPALDGLGLGGFRGMPFAEASVAGEGAVIELVERLPPDERPDVLAIYRSWWPELSAHFGRERFAVRIDDNVICGASEKTVFDADWSLLQDRARTSLDFGDLTDERAKRVVFSPRPPRVTSVIATLEDAREGPRQFDGVRPLAGGDDVANGVAFDAPEGSTLWLHAKGDAELEIDGAHLSIAGAPSFRALRLGRGARHDLRVTRGVIGLAWVEGQPP